MSIERSTEVMATYLGEVLGKRKFELIPEFVDEEMLDHATGLVIGETTVIGNNVSILHSVTLGGVGSESGNRHPKIESGLVLSLISLICLFYLFSCIAKQANNEKFLLNLQQGIFWHK